MNNTLTEEFLNDVYSILVNTGGAKEDERFDFIDIHLNSENCTEYRFGGKFGSGGKYRSTWNSVTAYSENITKSMQYDLNNINQLLKKLKDGKCN
jgi:hypothetical protein